MKTSYTPEFK